jgi:hypothetical protein
MEQKISQSEREKNEIELELKTCLNRLDSVTSSLKDLEVKVIS